MPRLVVWLLVGGVILAVLVLSATIAAAQSAPVDAAGILCPENEQGSEPTTKPSPAAQPPSQAKPQPQPDPATPRRPEPLYPTRLALLTALGILLLPLFLAIGAARLDESQPTCWLHPGFFLCLNLFYLAALALIAVAYSANAYGFQGVMAGLFDGVVPVAVPWFGALGAVFISLQGVCHWSDCWDARYNYWHIVRPVVGAITGLVSFFIIVLVNLLSHTTPKFLDAANGTAPSAKDVVLFYVLAFIVGYREETFRELVKRVTDLILRLGNPKAEPGVTVKMGGNTVNSIQWAKGDAGVKTVEVQNTGTAPLSMAEISVAAGRATPAAAFAKGADNLTDAGELAPGDYRTVEIAFSEKGVTGKAVGTLRITAANLAMPKTVGLIAEKG